MIDTTALAGTGADQPGTYSTFTFTNTVPATSGVAGGYSGQWLTWDFPRLGHVTAPPGGVGAGISLNGTPEFLGTFQYGDRRARTTARGTWTTSWRPAPTCTSRTSGGCPRPSPRSPAAPPTPPGITTRMGFLWQTVLSGGGTVPAVPSVATDWGTVTSAKLNGMGSALTLLNNPPSLRVSSATSQNIAASTRTVIQFPAVHLDNYAGWSTATSAPTPPRCPACTCSPPGPWGTATSTGVRWSGLNVIAGGSTVSLAGARLPGRPRRARGQRSRVDRHRPGPHPRPQRRRPGAVPSPRRTPPSPLPVYNAPRLIGAYMTPQAAAGTVLSYTPPVTGFRFQAGALAGTALTAALNNRIGNDVELPDEPALLHRLPGHRADRVRQHSGFHQITMDTVGALPRGGNGDNYGGWSASNHWYASQVAGWYLVIADLYAVPPPAGTAGDPHRRDLLLLLRRRHPGRPPPTTTSRCTTRPRTTRRPARSAWACTTSSPASTSTRCSAPPRGAAPGGRRSAPGRPGPSIRS